MTEAEAKEILKNDTPDGNIAKRLEALEVAEHVLGEGYTAGDLYRWADKE